MVKSQGQGSILNLENTKTDYEGGAGQSHLFSDSLASRPISTSKHEKIFDFILHVKIGLQ